MNIWELQCNALKQQDLQAEEISKNAQHLHKGQEV